MLSARIDLSDPDMGLKPACCGCVLPTAAKTGRVCRNSLPNSPMPNAQCPMPNAQCPMPNAQCPMSNVQCPMSNIFRRCRRHATTACGLQPHVPNWKLIRVLKARRNSTLHQSALEIRVSAQLVAVEIHDLLALFRGNSSVVDGFFYEASPTNQARA